MKKIEVTAAVIGNNRRYLVALRPENKHLGGTWEFPGGKIEPGETPEACLGRELMEELEIETRVGARVGESVHIYPDRIIHLTAFYVEILRGRPVALFHDRLKWASPEEMEKMDFSPADHFIIRLLAERPGK